MRGSIANVVDGSDDPCSPPAKFALSRLPPSLAKLPLSQNLLSLLSAVWKKQYDQVYTRAGHVTALVQREPPLPNFDLGPLVVRLVQIFIGTSFK